MSAALENKRQPVAPDRLRLRLEHDLQESWRKMVEEVGWQRAMEAIGRDVETTAREAGSWNRQELFIRAEMFFNFAEELGRDE